MEKLQIERIKNEGIIDIKLSGSFYKRIQHVLNFIASVEDKDSLTDLIDKLNDEVSDENFSEWETVVETMMILCSEIETKAKEQGHTEMVDIEVTPTTTDAPTANL